MTKDQKTVAIGALSGVVGMVELSGPAIMSGYYDDEAATREAIRGGWLVTGDLGYIADGELFLVGRAKDVVFIERAP